MSVELSAGGRVEAVNVLRAIVCFGILTKHFTTHAPFAAHWGEWVRQWVHWVPGTECFLVVSGYFLAHMFRPGESQYLSVPQFARRRGLRLLVPYWVALSVAYVGLIVWRLVVPGKTVVDVYEPPAVLANVLGVPDVFNAPTPILFFWTVSTLVQMYAMWAVAFWVVRRYFLARGVEDFHRRTERVMIVLTWIALVVSGGLTWTGLMPDWNWQLPRWCAYPTAGAITYWTMRGRSARTAYLGMGVLFAVGALVSGSPRPLFGGLTCLLLLASGSGWLPAPRGLLTSVLSAIGSWSYSVYLVHGLVGVRVWAVLALLGLSPDTPVKAAVLVLIAMLASLVAGWVLFVLVERPMSHRALSVGYRR